MEGKRRSQGGFASSIYGPTKYQSPFGVRASTTASQDRPPSGRSRPSRRARPSYLCKLKACRGSLYFDCHLFQDQLDDVVVKRAKALHAQTHYAAELEKEKTKRDALQGVADTVQMEFEVGLRRDCLNAPD